MNLFLENLISASTQVGMLYVMVAAGFICDKTGLFSEETAKKAVQQIKNQGVKNVIITLGEKGCVYNDGDDVLL